MITRIQTLNFRCLRYIDQRVAPFQVLVGPNASGKTTFLDTVNFLGAILSKGLDEAIRERTANFQDLVWGRNGTRIELAIEASLPDRLRAELKGAQYKDRIRYEVGLVWSEQDSLVEFSHERVLLLSGLGHEDEAACLDLFPRAAVPAETIFLPNSGKFRTIVKKVRGGNDNFYSAVKPHSGEGGWAPSFRLGPRRSALGNLPAGESRLAPASWLREFLTEGVQSFMLNSALLRRASPPGQGRGFRTDGGNLPWVIESLLNGSPDRYALWIRHLRTALGDLAEVRVVERADDRHKYLMLRYDSGIEVPSWMASDGTLRLLALTLPAYMLDFSGVFLIEEPENGVHPRAVETLCQSLRSTYHAQVLMATHSPVILSQVEPKDVLCFAKTPDGQTDTVRGDQHPALREWRRGIDLGMLLAGGVLG